MNIPDIIGQVQRALGFPEEQVDEKAGPQTWAAILARIGPPPLVKPIGQTVADGDRVDDRSEKSIATLQPQVQPYARALIHKAAAIGLCIEVISATRGEEEQNALYAQGRTAPGRIVTNARFGYSNHNFGIAFDIGLFQGGQYVPESPAYKAIGALGREIGLEWGGDWQSIDDEPHFQLRPLWAKALTEGEMEAELREGRAIA